MNSQQVDKFNKIHDKLESKTHLRMMKRLHAVVAYVFLAIVLATGGLYGHELTMSPNSVLVGNSIIPTQEQFGDGDQVEFYVLVALKDGRTADMHTVLICDDFGDGGERYISEDHSMLNTTNTASHEARLDVQTFYDTAHHKIPNDQFSKGLRTLITTDTSPVEFQGLPPHNDTSKCYGNHTITTYTPIFDIPLTVTVRSYAFDYVWFADFTQQSTHINTRTNHEYDTQDIH